MSAAEGEPRAEQQSGRHSAVIEYYDETRFDYRAVWYNKQNFAFHFGYYGDSIVEHARALENSNRVLAQIARVEPGDRVLDAGCGVGGSSFWLAQHRAAEVVGITPVMHQVKKARAIAVARSLGERVRFECADYCRTLFDEASFDVVWALESLCHADEKPAFYREAWRVLRSGGRLVVAEYIRATRNTAPRAEALMREWLDGWVIPDLDTAEEHLRAATDAGFLDAHLADYTAVTRRSLRRLYKLAYIAYGIDWTLYELGLRSRAQHANVIASLGQYRALRQGLWFYGILSATKP